MNQRHAVIFSGGGADGAYEVGVAKALLNGKAPTTDRPLDPEVFTGTSIGSFNASFLVSRWEELGAASVGDLEKVWLERIAQPPGRPPGFRIRLNPMDYLDPRSYYPNPLVTGARFFADSAEIGWDGMQRAVNLLSGKDPFLERVLEMFNLSTFVSASGWEQIIRESIDFRKIRDSEKELFVAATNWILGDLRIFDKHDMTDKLGPAAIRASSSVPGFYPMATVGAQKYVDGAVLMNTPLKPAIRAGADVLHVIYMNTDVKRMPVDELRSTLDTLYRTQIIAWAEAVNRDIKRARSYNQGLDLLHRSAHGEDLPEEKMKDFVGAAGPIARRLKAKRSYRTVTIHRYFPPDGLSGALGFLNLSRERLERLIDEGFQNTVAHDCVANGCVIPETHEHEHDGEGTTAFC